MTNGPTARVVCIGIATLDAIAEVDRLPGADERVPAIGSVLAGGGVTATAAVTLARLGVPVRLVASVGDDRTGCWIRDDLTAEGVDTSGVRLEPGCRSPMSLVLVEQATGARALVPDLGGAGPPTPSDADLDACRAAAWIHVDHVGAALIPALKQAGVTTPISLDDGVGIPDLDLSGVTLYGPTEAVLTQRHPERPIETALDTALAEGPRIVIATRGALGALAAERVDGSTTPRRHAARPWPIDVRSTLGAGDVFHGALLAGLVEERPLGEALDRASACAALACEALDGRSGIPDLARLDRFLASGRDRAADASFHG